MELKKIEIRYSHDGKSTSLEAAGIRELGGMNSPFTLETAVSPSGTGTIISARIISEAKGPLEIGHFSLRYSLETSYLTCFRNGYQSWSESREVSACEREQPLRPAGRIFKLRRFGWYHGLPRETGQFLSHTYTFLRESEASVLLIGSFDESAGFAVIEIDMIGNELAVSKDLFGGVYPPGQKLLSLFVRGGTEAEVFTEYRGLAYSSCAQDRAGGCVSVPGGGADVSGADTLPTGWTSWYNYYTDISEEKLLHNIDALKTTGAPIDFFQIDDGYQRAVGDWLDIGTGFPGGMKYIADKTREAGSRPGIWLAPFICEKRSALARNHPEWILRDGRGRKAAAGWNPGWSGTFYALDTQNSEVRDYLRKVFRTVFDEWGYELVKLDFLYAAALVPVNGKSRGAVMYEALQFLRECAGDKLILGCGVPLGSALYQTDMCRIGSDAALSWEDRLLKNLGYRERVSTVNSLRNTVGRRQLTLRWKDTPGTRHPFLSDPDVFILRSRGNTLAPEERYTLFLINGVFGRLLFTSDDVSRYTFSERELFLSLFPFREKEFISVRTSGDTVVARFCIGPLEYVVYANLGSGSAGFRLPNGAYFSSRNSEGVYAPKFLTEGELIDLKPHTSACLLALADAPYTAAGGSGSLFPGSEIMNISMSNTSVRIEFHPHVRNETEVFVRTPGPGKYSVNGESAEAEEVLPSVWICRSGLLKR